MKPVIPKLFTSDSPLTYKLIIMKQTLIAFARNVDAVCARMNSGLGAVAIVLGILVVASVVVRAQQQMPTTLTDMPFGYQATVGQ